MPDDSMGADDELSGRLPSEDLEGDEEDGSEGSEESDKDDDDGPPTPPTTIGRADEPVDDVSTSLRQKRAEDIKKGKAIARQLVSTFAPSLHSLTRTTGLVGLCP
jgi:hypothetical protein